MNARIFHIQFAACLIVLLIVLFWVGTVQGQSLQKSEAAINESTRIITLKTGSTNITRAINGKDQLQRAVVLTTETRKALTAEKLPLAVSAPETRTEIRIMAYSCDARRYRLDGDACGYWITATRNGEEVATNSPIWLSGDVPYHVLVSEVYDEKTNELTQTVKEDPLGSVLQILSGYVDRQPLGKAVVGTQP